MYNPFSTRGRLGRAKYWLTLVTFFVAAVPLTCYIGVMVIRAQGGVSRDEIPVVTELLSDIAAVVWFVIIAFPTVRRFHDMDRPGSHFWRLLVPLYNLVLVIKLLTVRGTGGPNKYGDDPLVKK
jgi:uncharacterized membrane protein YhaH (DUF805 family)